MSRFAILLTVFVAMLSSSIHAAEEAPRRRISQLVWSESSETDVRLPTPREPDLEEKAQYLRSFNSESRHLSFWGNIMNQVNKSKCKLSCTYKENSTEIEYCKEDCEQHHAKPKNNGGSGGSTSGGSSSGGSTSGGSTSGGSTSGGSTSGGSTSGGSSSGGSTGGDSTSGGSSSGGSTSGGSTSGGGSSWWEDLFNGGGSGGSGGSGTDTWNGESYCNENNICSNVDGGASAWDGNLDGNNNIPADQCGGGKNSNDGSWSGCFECLGDGTWCKDLTQSTDEYIEICVGGEGTCGFQDDTGKDCTVICNPLDGSDCYDSNGNDCISPYCAISSLGMPTPSPTAFTSNDAFTFSVQSAIEKSGPVFGAITVCGVAVIASLALRKRYNTFSGGKDHLLSGAVGKRMRTVTDIFGSKKSPAIDDTLPQDDFSPNIEMATHYVKA